ncbi:MULTISPECIES: MarR family winged helix-turn-helix transcriptional regulator [Desulfitobacterium]|uniref:Transcriptional regulator n=2 Tax=Desulfitobacterium dehalogenans TaxID=36854 RepID=I4A6R9_DESDJ|nr:MULTISPECIES: MarR family winged helix-turn-helix transcriptional regulator [Desulfitobacterium]AFL99653.1 transcriptional regulator [Desulfitobacterium dehalogenans ATCC 51507]HHY25960.1 winged helix-turn-helix transcriptional regulator [Desulfitobacterium dehalogenans]
MKSMVFENEIWDFLRTITEGMANAFRPIVEEHGLTLMQTRILVEVKDGGPHTIGSLGGIIGLTSGNASSMCKKLETAGFLRRIRTPEDERFVKLTLTQHGEDTVYRIEEALERRYGAFLEHKGEKEYQRFIECMDNVKAFMQEMYRFDPK